MQRIAADVYLYRVAEHRHTDDDSVAHQWAVHTLGRHGIDVTDESPIRTTNPWSTVTAINTSHGRYWLKQAPHFAPSEAGVHDCLATIAPHWVDEPIAHDSARGWLLTPDGGPVAGQTWPTNTLDMDTLGVVLRDYAHLQQATIEHRRQIVRAGLPDSDPGRAGDIAAGQAQRMASFAAHDPRHLTAEQRDSVLNALPALRDAGAALATGPVPLTIDHRDLARRNVFLPRSGGEPYRFFDFGEARWAHPFGSLVMFMWNFIGLWKTPRPPDVIDCTDPRIAAAFDTYLSCWTDYAPMKQLRELAEHALRLQPLHRADVWLRILDNAPATAIAQRGRTPWAWLEEVVLPVRLS